MKTVGGMDESGIVILLLELRTSALSISVDFLATRLAPYFSDLQSGKWLIHRTHKTNIPDRQFQLSQFALSSGNVFLS